MRDGEDEVDAERDHEQLLPPEPVGQVAEEQRADDCADEVPGAGGRRPAASRGGACRACVSTLASAPTSVTSKPSRIHVIPRPMTTSQCQRLQGSRSSRRGIMVSTASPVAPSSPAVVAWALTPSYLPDHPKPKRADGTLLRGEAPACGLLARRVGQGCAFGPAPPRRPAPGLASVRGQGDDRAGADVPTLRGRRPGLVVAPRALTRLELPVRARYLPRAALPDRRRRERTRPVRLDRLVDDLNHFVNWGILTTAFGLLLVRLPLGRLNVAALMVGFGAVTALLWEFAEYFTLHPRRARGEDRLHRHAGRPRARADGLGGRGPAHRDASVASCAGMTSSSPAR